MLNWSNYFVRFDSRHKYFIAHLKYWTKLESLVDCCCCWKLDHSVLQCHNDMPSRRSKDFKLLVIDIKRDIQRRLDQNQSTSSHVQFQFGANLFHLLYWIVTCCTAAIADWHYHLHQTRVKGNTHYDRNETCRWEERVREGLLAEVSLRNFVIA